MIAAVLAATGLLGACASARAGGRTWPTRTCWRARRRTIALGTHATNAPRPRVRPPVWIERRLVAAALPGAPVFVWHVGLTATASATLVGLLLGGAPAGVLGGGAVGTGGLLLLHLRRDAGKRAEAACLPGVLEDVARSLRGGLSLRQALADASAHPPGALGTELQALSHRLSAGVPLTAALDAWARASAVPGASLAVAALALGAQAGGPQAQAVDGVAATLRARLAIEAEIRAQATQARASAALIAVAPLAFTGLACATDPRTRDFLFRTAAGLACLTAGLALDGAAAWWMARITRSAA